MSSPLRRMLPWSASSRRTMSRPQVVLPLPLSPTKPKISPWRSERFISFKATTRRPPPLKTLPLVR